MDEMFLIDKPAGMTSFGVVARMRRILNEEAKILAAERGETAPKRVKVGHTGTLDPFATGLLIIMAGKGTKRCQEFLKLDKEYIAKMELGKTSTTGDVEGEIKEISDDTECPLGKIQDVLVKFTGRIRQRPPIYSAIKIDGRRAYDLARKGVEVEMPEREVEIYELEILEYKWPELVIRVKASSGTYIRSLAEDIGKELGCGAYLKELRRTEVGKYRVEDATSLDEWMAEREKHLA